MPYIKQEYRDVIGMKTDHLDPTTSGELNYLFTEICNQYMQNRGHSYHVFNDMIGALEGCKLELYRRMVAPYEDTKIAENGDVFF